MARLHTPAKPHRLKSLNPISSADALVRNATLLTLSAQPTEGLPSCDNFSRFWHRQIAGGSLGGLCPGTRSSQAPASLGRQESVTLLLIGRRNQHGFVMRQKSMLIQRGRGLRPDVAVLALEVKSGDAIFATLALERDAALDPCGCVTPHNCH